MAKAVVNACERFYYSSGLIFTNPFSSDATNKIYSDVDESFVLLARRTKRGASFPWPMNPVPCSCP